jgi:hypothetical protein
MSQCQYYKVEKETLRSSVLGFGRDPLPPKINLIPWCNHPKHSPVSKSDAAELVGGGNLTCEGDLDRCPIKDKFRDI